MERLRKMNGRRYMEEPMLDLLPGGWIEQVRSSPLLRSPLIIAVHYHILSRSKAECGKALQLDIHLCPPLYSTNGA